MAARSPVGLGARVVDQEDPAPDPDPAVVVDIPGAPADDWHVAGRGTVAADNPQYPSDAPVVVVVFEAELGPYDLYTGVQPLPLGTLHERGVSYYAFPAPRLDQVGSREPQSVPIERFQPAPFHARSFDADANAGFIAEIDARGGLDGPPPFARVRESGALELLNGHKRVWAATVAGVSTLPVRAMYHVDDDHAARLWAARHLADYAPAERERALARLRDRLGAEPAGAIAREHGPAAPATTDDTPSTDTEQSATDRSTEELA